MSVLCPFPVRCLSGSGFFLCENIAEVMKMQGNPYTAYQPIYGNPYGMRMQQQYYQPQPMQPMEQAAVVMVSDRREVDSQIVNDLLPHYYANRNGAEIYVKQLDTATGKSVVTVYKAEMAQQAAPMEYASAADLRALAGRVDDLAAALDAGYTPKRALNGGVSNDAE